MTQLDAYELYLQARVRMARYDTVLEAMPFLVRAIEIDPNVAMAHAMISIVLTSKWLLEGDGDTLKSALIHGRSAVRLGPQEAWSHVSLGHALIFMGQLDEALPHIEQAVSLNPNETRSRAIRGLCRNYLGQYEEALADLDDCIARDPLNYDWFWDLRGQILMVLGRYPEAITSYRNLNAYAFWAYAFVAVCHWRMGDKLLAADAARKCLTARPGANVSTILIDPYRDPIVLDDLRRDLLAVGIPDG